MLEVIYNDPFTRLSLIDNTDIETAYIVDDSLSIYAKIEYWDSDISLISEKWQKALEEYLQIEDIDNTITYRKMLAQKSIATFKQFLKELEND